MLQSVSLIANLDRYYTMKFRKNAVTLATALCAHVARQLSLHSVIVTTTTCCKAAGESKSVDLVVATSFSTLSAIMYQQIIKH